MPRSNWKGVISFGLVSIPIVLYPAENKSANISFHQIDKRDNARIKYQRINENTGKVVPWEQISRGYEYDKNMTIPVPDEVLKKVAGENARSIDIETFIDAKDLNVLSIENIYYLVPDKNGQKGYVILRESLAESNKIGIAKVIISTKEYLAAIMPYEKALVLCLLKYDKEMRKPEDFDLPVKDIKSYKINKKEIDIAKQLIKSMSSKWKPEKYVDEYQKAVHKWVEESANKLPHTAMKQRAHAKTSNVVNFVDLLKKSLASSGKSTNGDKKTAVKNKKVVKGKSKTARHVTKH
jgi:DNA end-binding protein Ku